MSSQTYTKVFKDKKKLDAMLTLRRQGFALISLGTIFGVDFSTIYYHCKKNNIHKMDEPKEFSIPSLISLYAIRSRRPKTYVEYLAESRLRSKHHA